MNSACTLLNVEIYVLFCLFSTKKRKIIIKKKKKKHTKNLTFQMQRCKQTALTLQSTRLHSITKRINMEDSQRPTRRTKTWFYPIFKCKLKQTNKKTNNKCTIDSFVLSESSSGETVCFFVLFFSGFHFETFNIFLLKAKTSPAQPEGRKRDVTLVHTRS